MGFTVMNGKIVATDVLGDAERLNQLDVASSMASAARGELHPARTRRPADPRPLNSSPTQ